MSQQEKDEKIDKMASEISAIKRWYPVFLALCTFATIVWGASHVWDNTVAKKQDIEKINNSLERLSNSINELKNIKSQTVVFDIKKDSSFIAIQNELYSIKKAIKTFKKQQQYKAVIGVKRNGPLGPTTFVPVNN